MPCRSMAVYAVLTLVNMLAVVEFDDFLIECVSVFKNNFMTG
jgi:hypothetical protein